MEKFAVQLHTVREEFKEDCFDTLEKVAELGYEAVEFAGLYGNDVVKVKQKLDELKLKVIGSHAPLDAMVDNIDAVIEENKVLKNNIIVCPWADWDTEEAFNNLVEKFKQVGEKINKEGMILAYHNHAHELVEQDGQYKLDQLVEATRDVNMMLEIDTHWVARAGVDVLEYLESQKDKICLLHIKDMIEKNGEQTFAAIGEGIMPIQEIVQFGEKNGFKGAIVENDRPEPTGIENIAVSIGYLKKLYS